MRVQSLCSVSLVSLFVALFCHSFCPLSCHLSHTNNTTTNHTTPLAEGQLLKLPANKFTVREREMLIGSGILPREFFEATQNPFVVGIGARELGLSCLGLSGFQQGFVCGACRHMRMA